MTSYAKQPTPRNPHLLAMARGKECLLLTVEGCRGHDGQTTVACHKNEGKGLAIKQSDAMTVWGCGPCHAWYDQSGAPRAEKRRAFDAAHQRQVIEWRKIAAGPEGKDKTSATWALQELGELIL